MSDLDEQGQQLLALLVSTLPNVVPNEPRTFISYKDVHDVLNLSLAGPTYGESLKHQGLNSLANWTATKGKPGITGLIIDRVTSMPGDGYFRLFGKTAEDFQWWAGEIQRSKQFDWSPFLPVAPAPPSPLASDLMEPAERQECITYRILRDTALARQVKQLNHYECQLCGHTIVLPNGSRYAEAHHIRPLGEPHNGPDIIENIICLCPNHHAELDYGARQLAVEDIRTAPRHSVSNIYIRYHNEIIYKPLPQPTAQPAVDWLAR
jgi:hypothetical protein